MQEVLKLERGGQSSIISTKEGGKRLGDLEISNREIGNLFEFAEEHKFGEWIGVFAELYNIVESLTNRERENSANNNGDEDINLKLEFILSVVTGKEIVEQIKNLPVEELRNLEEYLEEILPSKAKRKQLCSYVMAVAAVDEGRGMTYEKVKSGEVEWNNSVEIEEIMNHPQTELTAILEKNKNGEVTGLSIIKPSTGQVVLELENPKPSRSSSQKDLEEIVKHRRFDEYLRDSLGYGWERFSPIDSIVIGNLQKVSIKAAGFDENDCPQIIVGRKVVIEGTNRDKREQDAAIEAIIKTSEEWNQGEYFIFVSKEPLLLPETMLNPEGGLCEVKVGKEVTEIIPTKRQLDINTQLYYNEYSQGIEFRDKSTEGMIISQGDIEWVIATTVQNEKERVERNNPDGSIYLDEIKGAMDFERLDWKKTGKKPIIYIDCQNADEPMVIVREAKQLKELITGEKGVDEREREKEKKTERTSGKTKGKGWDY